MKRKKKTNFVFTGNLVEINSISELSKQYKYLNDSDLERVVDKYVELYDEQPESVLMLKRTLGEMYYIQDSEVFGYEIDHL